MRTAAGTLPPPLVTSGKRSEMDIFQAISELLEGGGRGALATVISANGSTPGKEGAKMLIREDGSTFGTIGGGCTEASVWALARTAMEKDQALRETFKLSPKQAGEEGLACGGTLEVFVEPIGSPVVILFGAGHIAQAVAKLCDSVGLEVQVVDDREKFANEERFPHATKIVVSDFETCFQKLSVKPSSYLVIVTRGHRYDQLTLAGALATPASFVGLIGSRVKIAHIFHNLKRQGVITQTPENVKAPIGLDIGARTPEEIAVSIVAQLIAHRRQAFVKGNDPERLPLHPLIEPREAREADVEPGAPEPGAPERGAPTAQGAGAGTPGTGTRTG